MILCLYSIYVNFHAYFLSYDGFYTHTHPISFNTLKCEECEASSEGQAFLPLVRI